MNKLSFVFQNQIVRIFTSILMLWFAFASKASAQDQRVIIDPAIYLEMVRVEIVSIDENGVGLLRVNMHDCGGCSEEFSFNSDSVFESPLGAYRGLAELSQWEDRYVLVVVGKQDGVIRRVTVI